MVLSPPHDGVSLCGVLSFIGNLQAVELPDLPPSMRYRVAAALWRPAGPAPVLLVSVYGYSDPTAAQLADLDAALTNTLEFLQVRGYTHVSLSLVT